MVAVVVASMAAVVVAVDSMAAAVVAVDSMAAADMAAVDIGNPSANVDVERLSALTLAAVCLRKLDV
jgi:hypothetical protein